MRYSTKVLPSVCSLSRTSMYYLSKVIDIHFLKQMKYYYDNFNFSYRQTFYCFRLYKTQIKSLQTCVGLWWIFGLHFVLRMLLSHC
jgi:hypothetical protein